MKFFLVKFEIFCEHHPLAFFQTIWNDFYDGLNPRLHVKSAKHRALIVPNWPKWPKSQSSNPHNFAENDHR